MHGRHDLIRPHGGYRKLRSFIVAQQVYDATIIFCDRFIDKRSRTHDQMVQAARSGAQNIAEGSMASATSKKTELKLTGVARASLEELLLDYEDFLRQRGLRIWPPNSPEALAVRAKFRSAPSDRSDKSDLSDNPYPCGILTAPPEAAASPRASTIHDNEYVELPASISRIIRGQAGGFFQQPRRPCFPAFLYFVNAAAPRARSPKLEGSGIGDEFIAAP
ncbi:MAG TPA: four helix bundle protein [Sedimentisphaerales bacterium]|nr:four helix bundle protein [Sedimentisphaerales bacterium]